MIIIILTLMHKDAFDDNREWLIQNMVDQVREAVLADHEELDETTYDLQRAFEMFLHSEEFNKKSETEKVHSWYM